MEMTEREMLEAEKYWCENCCNWDKEEVQMDACSTCKLTGTRVFAQESGKECKCFNVPEENVIVPPCKVGDTVYAVSNNKVYKTKVFSMVAETEDKKWVYILKCNIFDGLSMFKNFLFGKTVFLTKEEAEQALKGGGKE